MTTNKLTSPISMAGDQPVVSVIMPSYNVASYIAEALDSVLAQTFTQFEVIVINDGSPDIDRLEQVLEPFQDRIVYIKQENRGLSGARNTGIRAARGKLIALLDPDDVWEPNYLERQVSLLEADPTIDVLYPNAVIFGDAPDAGRKYMDICPSTGEVTFESLITRRCNVFVSVTARRQAILQAGLFDETLRSVEDFDLWLRIAKQGGRIAYHREVLARYRRRPDSLSADPIWLLTHIEKVFLKAASTLPLSDYERNVIEGELIEIRAILSLHEGKRAFFRGDVLGAIKKLTTANIHLNNRKLAMTLRLMRLAPRLLMRAYNIRDRFILRTSTKY